MKYCVCNYQGHLAGHDMDRNTANHVLEVMSSIEPDEEWEIIEQE